MRKVSSTPVDRVIIRTKLHAVIVLRMFELGWIGRGAHLIVVRYGSASSGTGEDLDSLLERLEPYLGEVRTWSRDKTGSLGMALLLAHELRAAQGKGRRVFIANLNWFALGLALKLAPGAIIHSFDDGSANVQDRPGSYLWKGPSEAAGLAGWLSRRLFPLGVAAYARYRIASHATIFPELGNVVAEPLLRRIAIDWSGLIEPRHRAQLPAPVRRILLGSVLRELAQRGHSLAWLEERTGTARRWADLSIPHPREPGTVTRPPWMATAPAEALIAHYASLGNIEVAHLNSSAALSFKGDSRIRWIDLLDPTANLAEPAPGANP